MNRIERSGTLVVSIDVASPADWKGVGGAIEQCVRAGFPLSLAAAPAAAAALPEFPKKAAIDFTRWLPQSQSTATRAAWAAWLDHPLAGSSPVIACEAGLTWDQADLLALRGISIVRSGALTLPSQGWRLIVGGRAKRAAVSNVRNIRFGLWEVAPSAVLTQTSATVIRRGLEQAARDGQIFVLRIDAASCTKQRTANEDFAKFLAHAARLQADGQLRIVPLAGLPEVLLPRRQTPSHSILRAVG